MMSLHIAGRLVRSPERKTSKNGKDYAQALVLVTAGDTEVLVTAMAFDPDLQARLLDLQKGDSLSACGGGSIRAYLDKEGLPAAGVSLMLNRLMAMTEGKLPPTPKHPRPGMASAGSKASTPLMTLPPRRNCRRWKPMMTRFPFEVTP